jgi:hypothetical protein
VSARVICQTGDPPSGGGLGLNVVKVQMLDKNDVPAHEKLPSTQLKPLRLLSFTYLQCETLALGLPPAGA